MKLQKINNPDISTNLKHPPGWKFLGCKRGHVKGKEDVIAPSKNKYVRSEVSILVMLISQTS
jgi:hypothetical protein